ncbi:hypothetical protein KI387_037997, partial [Taxus chinensis]
IREEALEINPTSWTEDGEFKMAMDDFPSYFHPSSNVKTLHEEMEKVKEFSSLPDSITDDQMEEAHSLFEAQKNE